MWVESFLVLDLFLAPTGVFSLLPSFLLKGPIKTRCRTHDQVSNEFLRAPGCLVDFYHYILN